MTAVNLLAISVGNTRSRVGVFVDSKLTETVTLANTDRDALLDAIEGAFGSVRDREAAGVLLASVNPPVSDDLEPEIARRLGVKPLRVERDLPVPIGRQLDRETIVGDDRLLNAAAAFDVLKQACVVIDAGTAITVDFIDGAGTFHGGAIAPGAQMMLDAMHHRTAQLPEVEFAVPVDPIGHNTVEAMRTGVFHGSRGLVRELVEQFAESAGSYPLVVATGGDGDLLFRDYDLVDRVVPDLTLLGLLVTYRSARENAMDS